MEFEISERMRRLANKGEWVGVDLDGTLFEFPEDGWQGWNKFGEPIPLMLARVKFWLSHGVAVRIVTARIDLPVSSKQPYEYSRDLRHYCYETVEPYSDYMMEKVIKAHLVKHDLPALPVQPHKGYDMIEFWDDRAVQVIANTGQSLAENHALLQQKHNIVLGSLANLREHVGRLQALTELPK